MFVKSLGVSKWSDSSTATVGSTNTLHMTAMFISRKIMDIIRAQEQSRDLHEQFHNQVTGFISVCSMLSPTPCHITLM